MNLDRYELQREVRIGNTDRLHIVVPSLSAVVEVLNHPKSTDMIVHGVVIVAEQKRQ